MRSMAINNSKIQTWWTGGATEFRTFDESDGAFVETVEVQDVVTFGQVLINGLIYLYKGRGTSAGEVPENAGLMLYDLTV